MFWNDIQVINLGQSGSPVNCMVLTNKSAELWVSCDNKIIILDTFNLMIIKEIQVYSSRRAKVSYRLDSYLTGPVYKVGGHDLERSRV